MAKIFGKNQDNMRIIVINETDWTTESGKIYAPGDYQVTSLFSGKKTILGINNDGTSFCYGNVDAISDPFAIVDGGITTTVVSGSDTYKIHTFTSSGMLSVKDVGNSTFECLVVAGGGTGGINGGGGGGGGGVIYRPSFSIGVGKHQVTVGAAGQDSTFSTLTAIKGGNGNSRDNSPTYATSGGSGGGTCAGLTSGTFNPGAGTSGQGYAGGSGTAYSQGVNAAGGGGGGASQVGGNGSYRQGGNGGNGYSCSITGTATYYGGGGGGGVTVNGTAGSNGLGGSASSYGGGNRAGLNYAPGGPGIVIIKYRIS